MVLRFYHSRPLVARLRDHALAAVAPGDGRLLRVQPPKAGLYVWAAVPEGHTSVSFATRLLDDLGVVVTPGVGYGAAGERYVRLSLTVAGDELEEGVRRLLSWWF